MGRLISLSLVFLTLLAANAGLASNAHAQTLVWQEEFDAPAINADHWVYDWGTGAQFGLDGWGNWEMQYYTDRPENARIQDGVLIIEARREDFSGMPFTSARLKTENRMSFKYGTLEARIRLPQLGNGLWPAYWLLGATGVWPGRGEIDIMEAGSATAIADGVVNRWIGSAVHWDVNGNYAGHYTSHVHETDLHDDFHIYRLTWDPEYIRASIDDTEYFTFYIGADVVESASLHEFHRPHFLLLNLAVGGTYTGIHNPAGVTAPLPGQMQIDYIRLYQDHPDSELHLGGYGVVPPPRFGVFTERDDLADALDFADPETHLYLWNNLAPIEDATPYEGSELMAFRANAGEWFGMGIIHDSGKNMSAYAGGDLKFHMRTTSTAPFRIGVSSAGGDSWLWFVDGEEQYGLARDGNWHEVTIPFSAFPPSLDLQTVRQMFMLVAEPPAQDVEIFIDDVYYLAPELDLFEDGFEATEEE